MRHDQNRAGIIAQIRLQPLGTFQIQVIRRFIQTEKVRLTDQLTRQCDAGFLAAGELGGATGQVLLGKTQTKRDLANPAVHRIAVGMFKPRHHLGILRQQRFRRVIPQRCKLRFDLPHMGFPGKNILIGLFQLFQYGSPAKIGFLPHIADGTGMKPTYLAAIGTLFVQQTAQQRRFTSPVRTD